MHKYIPRLVIFICCNFLHFTLYAQSKNTRVELINKQPTFLKLVSSHLYITTGMNFNKQSISLNGYTSKFNYDLNDYNKNLFKPGFFIGFRYEGSKKSNQKMIYSIGLQKIVAGSNYLDEMSIPPLIKKFTSFKADDQLVIMHLSSYYKQEFPFGSTNKNKISLVIGPSMNIRLSEQRPDNLINKNYKHIYFSGDGGLEFNKPSFCTLFVHYKLALSSFTKAPINNYMNSVEIGTIIKTSELF